jgi:hypothetical protein
VDSDVDPVVVASSPDVAQAESKSAISKSKTPVSAACLITDAEPIYGHFRCNYPSCEE